MILSRRILDSAAGKAAATAMRYFEHQTAGKEENIKLWWRRAASLPGNLMQAMETASLCILLFLN
jgi:hypothetical protein